MKIEFTGCFNNGEFIFKNLILAPEEYQEVDDLEKLAKQNQVDFICVEKEGEIDYIHMTDIDNIESIEEKGIINDKDNIPDLGAGIYVVEKHNLEGIENLKTYLEDYPDEEIAVVTGTYKGKYIECVYGYGHVGYIVIKTDKLDYDDIDIIDVEDFIWKC